MVHTAVTLGHGLNMILGCNNVVVRVGLHCGSWGGMRWRVWLVGRGVGSRSSSIPGFGELLQIIQARLGSKKVSGEGIEFWG